MNRVVSILFALAMVLGLLVSAFVIVSSLQAATLQPGGVEIAATKPKSAPSATVAQGRALFIAKGCIVCHRNDNIMPPDERVMEFGDVPNLTAVRINEDYLRRWLQDPHGVKPATNMPDLDLSEAEIDALTAFLMAPPEK